MTEHSSSLYCSSFAVPCLGVQIPLGDESVKVELDRAQGSGATSLSTTADLPAKEVPIVHEKSLDVLVLETNRDLDAQRKMRIGWSDLMCNRPWHSEPVAPFPTKVLESPSVWEGTEEIPWPLGVRPADGFYSFMWAYISFLWALKRPYYSHFLTGVTSLADLGKSVVLGYLVGELTKTDGLDTDKIWIYLVIYIGLFTLQQYSRYQYEIDVPCASVRQEVRHILMYKLLKIPQPDRDNGAISNAEALNLLSTCVHSSVNNVWESIFLFQQMIILAVGGLAFVVHTLVGNNAKWLTWATTFFIFITNIFLVPLIFSLKQKNCIDLNTSTREAQLHMFAQAMATLQNFRRSTEFNPTEQKQEQAAFDFGNAAMLYRKRDFHAYFINLANKITCQGVTIAMTMFIYVILSYEVKEGVVTVTNAMVIISLAKLMVETSTTLGSNLSDCVIGYVDLKKIADVLNW